jgi:hypothetical protein
MVKIFLLLYALIEATILAGAEAEVHKDLEELKLGDIEPKVDIRQALPTEAKPDLSKLPFKIPEIIKFDVYHETLVSRVLGGHCYMKILDLVKVEGRWALHFKLEAVSAEWYHWIIVLKEDIEGFIDLETSQTHFLKIDKQEGSYRQTKTVAFDYKNHRILEKDVTKKETVFHQYRLDQNVIDSYSVLFLIRRTNLNNTKEIAYQVYSNGKVYDLKTVIHGSKSIEARGKKYDTNRVEVLSKVQGALEQKKGIFMYFTKGLTQYPVFSQADVKVGVFSVEMVDVP